VEAGHTHPIPSQVLGDVPETFGPNGEVLTVNGQRTSADPKIHGTGHAHTGHTTPTQVGTAATEALFNSLVGQYQSSMAAVDPYINGTVAAQDQAASSAIGASIGGPTGPAPAAAAGIDKTLAGDAAAYAKANDAGAAGIASALKGMGQANAANLATSPYAALIQGALAGSSYNIEKGTLPPAYSKNLPAWATQIIANTVGGGAPGASAVGSNVPLVTPSSPGATTPSTDTSGSPSNTAGP
jgi:hypothetical protein